MPRSATTPTPNDAAPASYEDAVQELERIVASMEGSALPLDRLLDSYTRAASLLEYCRGRLEAVETQVKVLEKGQLAPWVAPDEPPGSLRSQPFGAGVSGFGRQGAADEP